jgi:hypothetical protein
MRTWPGVTFAAVLLAAGPGRAQETPKDDPALTDPSVGQKATELDKPRSPAPGLAPTAAPAASPVSPGVPPVTAIPGLESTDLAVARAPLRREGTFLLRQRGSMVRLRTGEWAFVFHRDAEGKAERPMLLVPSQNLARMEHLAADRASSVAFLLTGQVFVYLGRNYILPTVPPVLVMADAVQAAPQPVAGGPDQAGGSPAPPAGANQGLGPDPDVDRLVRELEAHREAPRSLGLARAPDAPRAHSDRPPDLLPDDTVIVRRRGRLIRAAGGETAFVMDNDADSGAAADPPLILVPCLNRERMEARAAQAAESLTFEVSGRVLTYQGRNYLIPSMFQVYPKTDLSRRQ